MTGATRLLRRSWDEAWGIKTRAVRRGLARRQAAVVPHLGVDEKAIAKRHRYLTVVADLERNRGCSIFADDRKQESLLGAPRWVWTLSAQQLGSWFAHTLLLRQDAFGRELDFLYECGKLWGYWKFRPSLRRCA